MYSTHIGQNVRCRLSYSVHRAVNELTVRRPLMVKHGEMVQCHVDSTAETAENPAPGPCPPA